MAYDGWLSFASTEIANVSRLQTYANAEIPGLLQNCDCDCDLLAEAVGDTPYTTPINDLAPWVDDDDEDTWGFYGVMPLSITGLQDATGTYEMTQRVGHGSSVGRYRRDNIQFRVRALLVARDQAALESGYSWFKAAVGEGCVDNCGGGSSFCYLSSCPTDLTEVGGLVTEEITVAQRAPGLLASEPFSAPLPCGEIRWTLPLSAATTTTATITVRSKREILFTYQVEVSQARQDFVVSDLGRGDTTVWVEIEGAVSVGRSTVSARTEPAWQDCADAFVRQLRDVVVVEGPRIIRDLSPSIGALREVEVVFEGAPWTFGSQVLVASMIRGDITNAPGASVAFLDDPPSPCEEEKVSWRDVMVDPNCRIDPPPPLARLGSTACAPPSDYNYAYEVQVPADMVPDWGDVVPSLRVTASGQSAVRGIRVRILPNLLGRSARELEPCSECASFAITYIPKGGAFVIDGMTERAYVEIADNTFSAMHYIDSARPGTGYTWPSLSCGVPYTFIIEVAGNNDVEGIELWLTPRE